MPGPRLDPILAVEALTKYFGGLRAVSLDLQVGEGERLCLIGPNGAGKSTFFGMLSGALAPTAGVIRFRGRDITGLDPFRIARLGISIKFQVPSVFDQLSVLQNLHLSAERRFGFVEGRKRAWRLIDYIGLRRRADDRAAWLSHGEKQWLEIGMAAVAEPALILLDEPTAGMSPEEVGRTAELVHELSQRATVIVIGHDMDFVRRIAQRVVVMHQGQLFAQGTMAEIQADPGVRDIYLGRSG
jgi:urea transport system ATP-binding protein